jgi:hypothetical protein
MCIKEMFEKINLDIQRKMLMEVLCRLDWVVSYLVSILSYFNPC